MDSAVEIPRRALFKPAEVCAIAKLQPYVLRSWEAEFPDLGVIKSRDTPRVYRRADLERVLRIKHLVFGEGLTLGAARRKLEAEWRPDADEALDDLVGRDVRDRLNEVKRGLRAILDLLLENGQRPQEAIGSAGVPVVAGGPARHPNASATLGALAAHSPRSLAPARRSRKVSAASAKRKRRGR